MDRRQKKTREAIFAAFTALLSQKSYNQISVQDIIDTAMGLPLGHYHYSCGSKTDSVFLHLLRHLQENDSHIIELLSSQNNEIFLRYFKENLRKLIELQYADTGLLKSKGLPEDYLVNHISSSFVETVNWWISRSMKEPPEQIAEYYLSVIEPAKAPLR